MENYSIRRAAGFAALLAAAALIALGAADYAKADVSAAGAGPSISTPVCHDVFSHQSGAPQVDHHQCAPLILE
jgi:hypothetical protein